jgi:hypothetical protein
MKEKEKQNKRKYNKTIEKKKPKNTLVLFQEDY